MSIQTAKAQWLNLLDQDTTSHNRWTFSDRQHQGLRSVRGFLSFALISVMSISSSQSFYVNFIDVDSRLPMIISSPMSIRGDFARRLHESYVEWCIDLAENAIHGRRQVLQVQEN